MSLLFCSSCSTKQHAPLLPKQGETALQVRELMTNYAQGKFLPPPSGNYASSGWIMKDQLGHTYQRSELIRQTSPIIEYGAQAVPELLAWTHHKEAYIRFIAAWSLKEITKQDPVFYYFGEPGVAFNGNSSWYEKCIAEWQAWYDLNRFYSTVDEDNSHGERVKP